MSKSRTGLVVDLHQGIAVVLTPAGEFVNVRLKKGDPWPELGEEITLPKVNQVQPFSITKLAAVAALLVFLVLTPLIYQSIFSLQLTEAEAISYLTVDINPSIELGLGSREQVISATALNIDGEKVLSRLKLLGIPGDRAMESIVEEAFKLGYLQSDKREQNILITYMPAKADKQKDKQKYVEQVQRALKAKQVQAQVEVLAADSAVRAKAADLGISAGKYLVLLEAIDNGLEISEEQIQKESLVKSIRNAGGDLQKLISKANHEKNIEELEKKVVNKLREKVLIEVSGKKDSVELQVQEQNQDAKELEHKPPKNSENDPPVKESQLKIELDKLKKIKEEQKPEKQDEESMREEISEDLNENIDQKDQIPVITKEELNKKQEKERAEAEKQTIEEKLKGKGKEEFIRELEEDGLEKSPIKNKGKDGNK